MNSKDHFSHQRRDYLKHAAATGLAMAGVSAQAQDVWPSKPIRWIVPFAPGGTSSVVARTIASELTKQLGVSFVIDNKGGGGGVPAMQEMLRAPADGYTIIMSHIGLMAVNPLIYPDSGYDVNKDFVPVTLLSRVPSLFVVNKDVPVTDLKSFIAYVKARPGRLNYASAGTPALLPHIKSGRLRCLAVGTPSRISVLPDVPTVAESGYPGFETVQWYGITARAGTPVAIINRLQQECAKAMKAPEVVAKYANESAIPGGGPSAEYGAFIAREQERWKEVVIKGQVKPG